MNSGKSDTFRRVAGEYSKSSLAKIRYPGPMPPEPGETLDMIVLGAGLRGLGAALAHTAAAPRKTLLVIDPLPQPGGSLRTQRTNGYLCELGPFALDAEQLAAATHHLPQAPTPIDALPGADHGYVFDGSSLQRVPLERAPRSFRTGLEELPQACRRALGPALRLGRAAIAITVANGEFPVELGGEVPTALTARQLLLALPLRTSARLLAGLDPHLGPLAERLRSEPRAFVFFGGDRRQLPTLGGYGIVPADGADTALTEVVHCSEVFANRALPGRCLLRLELTLSNGAERDEAVIQLALDELQRFTGARPEFGLHKVHRFERDLDDAVAAECRTRLRALHGRVPGLTIVGDARGDTL